MTLPEIMVTCALLVTVGVALANVYRLCIAAWRHGEGRVSIQQRCRETTRRIEPLLMAAIPPTSAQEAIYKPDVGATEACVEFSSPSRLFEGTSIETMDPRSPSLSLYRIRFDAGRVVLENADNPGQNRTLGRDLYDVRFKRTATDTIQVRVESRAPIPGTRDQVVSSVLETIHQVPYYTSK